ncbi:MAG: cytochrome bc complex cytochrome b subunit [Anaerolineae bacterium]
MAISTRVADWVDERTGTRVIQETLLDRLMPTGIGWVYTLGSASLFVFTLQTITGIFLAMNYVPAPDHAYDSILYITNEVAFGWLLRGLHRWGASAMVLLVFVHMLRVFFMGAYKYPREVTWMVGVVLLLLTIAFGFTGYLLPWDQKAYWATMVGTNLAGQAPLVGDLMTKVLRGGESLGAMTLNRFFAFHVMLLPAITMGLIGVHLYLVVRHGISAPPERTGSMPPDETQEWQPEWGTEWQPEALESETVGEGTVR